MLCGLSSIKPRSLLYLIALLLLFLTLAKMVSRPNLLKACSNNKIEAPNVIPVPLNLLLPIKRPASPDFVLKWFNSQKWLVKTLQSIVKYDVSESLLKFVSINFFYL